jgi:hypothetical protein
MRDTTLNFVVNPRQEVFAGPVAVLVDGLSASTSEIFAGGLRTWAALACSGRTPQLLRSLRPSSVCPMARFQYALANYISQEASP